MLYAPPMLLPISIALMVAAVPEKSPLPDAAALKKMTARLAPVDLEVDISKLPQPERAALAKMVEAAQIMDPLFLRQSWSGNETLFFTLAQDKSPLGQERLHAFFQNKGPWDRIDLNRPFIPGVPEEKPPSGNFYPAGATKADVERWMKSLPEARRRQAAGFYTTIRRDAAGKFHIVPYSVEYQGELSRAAALLREAAQLADEPTLRDFLSKRAMLKNVQELKFQKVLQPIADVALAPADQKNVSFDAFFTHILMHELMHGLGPHEVAAGGKRVTVREKLQDTYSALEEAKAY